MIALDSPFFCVWLTVSISVGIVAAGALAFFAGRAVLQFLDAMDDLNRGI